MTAGILRFGIAISVLVLVALSAEALSSEEATRSAFAGDAIQGDADCDRDVDAVDGLHVLRFVAAIGPFAGCVQEGGDVTCDSALAATDALGILRFVAALPPLTTPPGCPSIGTAIEPTTSIEWEQATSPQATGFWSVTFSPSDSNVIFVASRDANVWKSEDGGTTWHQIGERLFGAHIFSNVAVHPTDRNYVYASNGFLFVSRDGGSEWESLFGSGDSLGVVSVAFALGEPDVRYAGDDRGRIYQATMAEEFLQVGQIPNEGLVTGLWVDPDDADVVLAETLDGLYRSEDGGQTLEPVLDGPILERSLTGAGPDSSVLYVVSSDRLMRSADGGRTWSELRDGGFIAVAAADQILYASFDDGSIEVSRDGGLTWTPTAFDPEAFGAEPRLAVDPTDGEHVVAATEVTIASSQDGGENWVEGEGLIVDDFFALATDPDDPNRLYAGLFWTLGVYRSDDAGGSWTWLSEYIHTPPGHEHYPMVIAVDPRNGDTAFVTGAYGMRVTYDGGASWTPLVGDFHMHGLAMDPSNPDVIYVGTGLGDVDKFVSGSHVYKTIDGGETWTALDDSFPSDDELNVYAIAVAESDADVVYVGTNQHDWADFHELHAEGRGIYRSVDGGASFSQVNAGLDDTNVFSIAVDPRNVDVVYAGTTGGQGAGNIYKTVNGGETWTDISEGLPNGITVHAIALWPQDPDVVVIGLGDNVQAGTGQPSHGAGVYISADGGETWYPASEPFTGRQEIVMALAFNLDGSLLFAGTEDGLFRGVIQR